jgi:Putative transposase, YhgA-like
MKETKKIGERPNRNKDHDDFVRGLFSYTEFVQKILQYSVPENLKPFIDFSTLTKSSETHVDEVLQITYSDTIYTAEVNKSAIPKAIRGRKQLPNFQFCFLGEFKSSIPNRPVDFQIDDYVKSVQMVDINNKKPPSIVVPILIYHGARKWKYKRLYDYFGQYLPQTILDYIPNPRYIVIDLQAMSDADIAAALDLGELRAAFVALKHAHQKEFFQKSLKEITKFANDLRPSVLFQTFFRMLMTYSQRRSKLDVEKFDTIVEQLKPEKNMATAFKSIFDYREEKAEKKGLEKGMEKGMAIAEALAKKREQEKNRQSIIRLIRTSQLENTQIAEVLDVPLALVEVIRLELEKTK